MSNSFLRTVILLPSVLLALTWGQQAPEGTAPQTSVATAPVAPQATPAYYRLEPGDTIELRFFFNPEVNDTVQIRPDGRISLQLIGEVEIAGLTVQGAVEKIQNAYVGQLKTPRVSVQVRGFAGQKVFVTGEVQRPGTLALPGGLSVMAAIADAGGFKSTANRDKIVLIRKGPEGSGTAQPLVIRVKGKVAQSAFLELQPYDVLLVPESRISRMDRWVDQYLKQLNPANMSVGFTYLYNVSSATTGVPF